MNILGDLLKSIGNPRGISLVWGHEARTWARNNGEETCKFYMCEISWSESFATNCDGDTADEAIQGCIDIYNRCLEQRPAETRLQIADLCNPFHYNASTDAEIEQAFKVAFNPELKELLDEFHYTMMDFHKKKILAGHMAYFHEILHITEFDNYGWQAEENK